MKIISTIDTAIYGGVRIATTLDGESVTLFVVVAEPDLELLAKIVPVDIFEGGAQVHASTVGVEDDAQDKLLEVLENMSTSDAAVFLCSDAIVLEAILDALNIADAAPRRMP